MASVVFSTPKSSVRPTPARSSPSSHNAPPLHNRQTSSPHTTTAGPLLDSILLSVATATKIPAHPPPLSRCLSSTGCRQPLSLQERQYLFPFPAHERASPSITVHAASKTQIANLPPPQESPTARCPSLSPCTSISPSLAASLYIRIAALQFPSIAQRRHHPYLHPLAPPTGSASSALQQFAQSADLNPRTAPPETRQHPPLSHALLSL